MDTYLFPGFPVTLEYHLPVYQGKKGVISAHADIGAGMELRSMLADNDISRNHVLAAKPFDSKALTSGIASVPRTSNTFFMCHISTPFNTLLLCNVFFLTGSFRFLFGFLPAHSRLDFHHLGLHFGGFSHLGLHFGGFSLF